MSQFYETEDPTPDVFWQAPFDRLAEESLGVENKVDSKIEGLRFVS